MIPQDAPPSLPPETPLHLSRWQNLFSVPEGEATSAQVIAWREARRPTYNKYDLV